MFTDIDFSENLTIGIKYEPQSCHWFNIQVSVISGIVKFKSEKTYHPYVSDSRVHDQFFSKQALKEMISSSDIPAVQRVGFDHNAHRVFKSLPPPLPGRN